MSVQFEYKGYLGSADVDGESETLHGRLLFIRDVIGYSADSVHDLKVRFQEAVDEYLALCSSRGEEPDLPCKGSFNIRVGPDRHRALAIAARGRGQGLNEYICWVIDSSLAGAVKHVHNHYVHVEESQRVSTGSPVHAWSRLNEHTARH